MVTAPETAFKVRFKLGIEWIAYGGTLPGGTGGEIQGAGTAISCLKGPRIIPLKKRSQSPHEILT